MVTDRVCSRGRRGLHSGLDDFGALGSGEMWVGVEKCYSLLDTGDELVFDPSWVVYGWLDTHSQSFFWKIINISMPGVRILRLRMISPYHNILNIIHICINLLRDLMHRPILVQSRQGKEILLWNFWCKFWCNIRICICWICNGHHLILLVKNLSKKLVYSAWMLAEFVHGRSSNFKNIRVHFQ